MYTNNELQQIFQGGFDLSAWTNILINLFGKGIDKDIRKTPESFDVPNEMGRGYYLGYLQPGTMRIGLFYYEITQGSVAHKRVGLRNLVRTFINPQWGDFEAALVIFADDKNWRLSFVCNLKGNATQPKRFTFVFGDADQYYQTATRRFCDLQTKAITFDTIKEAFSVEALTKQFYNDLFQWYQWAVDEKSGITFPNNTATEADDREQIDTKIIRLITRLMFVWFIKQKELVPNILFCANDLRQVVKDFDPLSTTNGNYYNAILQNLFFATLNRAIIDDEGNKRGFAKAATKDVKTLYRYSELFQTSETEVVDLFSEIPFLNGGLFECLDKTKTIDGVERAYNYDGFSRNDKTFIDGRYRNRAFIPNVLFFEPTKGLFPILSRYNFTIEENTPNEQQVALDPELLGKVFENMLGAYNPETKETARNQSGSFYTPREIVNYMVDESLIAYLGDTPLVRSLFADDFILDEQRWSDYQFIAGKLKSVKVLDPACGSGAFPMGLLNRIVDVLKKINTDESTYQLKINLIENCIYGIDIQSIATQISKLRFFISLICNCEKDTTKPNFGIPTLPNLETKFVCANSLLGKKKRQQQLSLFEDAEIEATNQELLKIRHDHFRAKSASTKRRLREKDESLRNKLAGLLSTSFTTPEDAEQLAQWNPYDQNSTADFFDAEWMFGVNDGFDIVIGNPPYIQLQNNGGELRKLYEHCGFQSFASTGDIYSLFYERGWQLLKQSGHLCYITSNKWMRAGYGEKTRCFFCQNIDPKLLIDFAGVKVFESATVDTNILLFSKSENTHNTICAVTSKANKESIKNLSVFVQHEHTVCDFASSDSWVILSPIEQSIKRKIEAVGTPLKDWDINIYRGVLTGYNEAFIISTAKRDEILANCADEDERKRTEELIRPILRGRDIKRYGYEWANLWLINTHNGVKGRIPRIQIDDFPAIKAYLDQHWDKIKDRADQGDTPYNLRNCAYMEDFDKPKIVYPNMTKYMPFVYDEDGFLTNQKCFIVTGRYMAYLTAFFNSSIFKFCFRDSFPELQGGTRELSKIFFDKIPVLKVSDSDDNDFRKAINKIQVQYTEEQAIEIDNMLFRLYKLTHKERQVIGFVAIE